MLKQKSLNGHGTDDVLDLVLNMKEGKTVKNEDDANNQGLVNQNKVSFPI